MTTKRILETLKKHDVYRPHAGTWCTPRMRGYHIFCCDCGLGHRINFRIKGARVQLQFFHAHRVTKALRRKRKHPFVRGK